MTKMKHEEFDNPMFMLGDPQNFDMQMTSGEWVAGQSSVLETALLALLEGQLSIQLKSFCS